jgi:hypothetical protein
MPGTRVQYKTAAGTSPRCGESARNTAHPGWDACGPDSRPQRPEGERGAHGTTKHWRGMLVYSLPRVLRQLTRWETPMGDTNPMVDWGAKSHGAGRIRGPVSG